MRYRIKARKSLLTRITAEFTNHKALNKAIADFKAKGYKVTEVSRI